MSLRIVIVCTANVCRSPMAGAMLAAASDAHGLDLDIRTGGLDVHELPVDPQAVAAMAARGLDISEHVPHLVEPADVDEADVVLTMTREHLRRIATDFPDSFPRTFTVKEMVRRLGRFGVPSPFDTTRLHDGRSPADLMGDSIDDDILDPFGGPPDVYRHCVDELDTATGSIATMLRLARTDTLR